jgi:hypothetical protein
MTESTDTQEAPVETKLPKGIDQETYDNAKAIIVSGFKANQTENDIKSAMFSQGIAFSDLVRLYKSISIGEGLVKSPKEISQGIADAVGGAMVLEDGVTNEDLTYDIFAPVIAKVLANVVGATEKKVVARIKNVLADMDLEMPKKLKAAKGARAGSKINKAIACLFETNVEATAEEFKVAMEAVTTEKSVKKWCRMFPLFSAIAQGKSVE